MATTTAWQFATSATSETFAGTIAWVGPANVTSSNDVRATAAHGSGTSTSRPLRALFAFASAVPADATITGVAISIERSANNNYRAKDAVVQLIGANTNALANRVGTNKASAAFWPLTTDAEALYGGPDDLWGAALTAEIVRGPGFGLDLASTSAQTVSARVDAIRMRITYDEPASANTGMSTQAIGLASGGGSSRMAIGAASARTLGAIATIGQGLVAIAATAAAALVVPLGGATGQMRITAAGAAVVGCFTSATATTSTRAMSSYALAAPTGVSAGTLANAGIAAASVGLMTSAAGGSPPVEAAAGSTLPAAIGASTGSLRITGTSTRQLGLVTSGATKSAIAANAAVMLPVPAVTAFAASAIAASGSAELASPAISASGDTSVSAEANGPTLAVLGSAAGVSRTEATSSAVLLAARSIATGQFAYPARRPGNIVQAPARLRSVRAPDRDRRVDGSARTRRIAASDRVRSVEAMR